MQIAAKRTTSLLTLCCFGSVSVFLFAGGQPAQVLKPELVSAWKKSGAEFGWIGVDKEGWGQLYFQSRKKGVTGEFPSFTFPWHEDDPSIFQKVPMPSVPFGMNLSGRGTRQLLAKISTFKTLHALSLSGPRASVNFG